MKTIATDKLETTTGGTFAYPAPYYPSFAPAPWYAPARPHFAPPQSWGWPAGGGWWPRSFHRRWW